ncbi:hypothetical protein T492DRAFT_995874 [Pavlovales sp. CCMP2436]|nr:hypothetical protein T492DRAFT_995874 [Pavlovales sp. CCMP2436]
MGVAAEMAGLAKLASLRTELATATEELRVLRKKSDKDRAALELAKANIASLAAVGIGGYKPLTAEQRVVGVLDQIDPKILWRAGNRGWSMSQTVRNHPASEGQCLAMGLSSDPVYAPKPLPAAKNAGLHALPLDLLYDPIANVLAFDEVENMKCDVALPQAPLPPFTLAHKHTHHLSRYTMYFNIMCWLKSEPRYGRVLDVSGSEPWLSIFDASRTEVVAVNYPQTDIHDLSSFPANSFDWVMADQVMEHLRFPQQAMDQVYRVLKPGGRAIMTSCAANPVHMFHDYWRFTMDAFKSLAVRFDSMDLCGSWGNGVVNAARALAGQFSGEPGSMLMKTVDGSEVVDPLSLKLAAQNEKDHAMTVWMIVRKL